MALEQNEVGCGRSRKIIKTVLACALVLAFLLGFGLSIKTHASCYHLGEKYTVESIIGEYKTKIEEYREYRAELLEWLASEHPEIWQFQQSCLHVAGTCTSTQPLMLKPIDRLSFAVPDELSQSVAPLQTFALSIASLLGLVALPPVMRHRRLRQALILGVVILCALGVGYFVGTVSAQTEDGVITIEPGSFVETASYVIWTDGTYVYAKNGRTGEIDFSGTDAATVIQRALDSLTSGRTWKEKVVLKGDLGYVHDVEVPSYTIIEGVGARLRLPADKSFIFKGKSNVREVTDVGIVGVEFEAETVNRSVECIGIDLSVGPSSGIARGVRIENCKFLNFVYGSGTPSGIRGTYYNLYIAKCDFISESGSGNSYPVYLGECTNVKIIGNFFRSNFGGSMIYTRRVVDVKIIGNDFVQDSNWDTAPIEAIDAHGTRIVIVGNTFNSLSVDGVLVDERLTYNVEDVVIADNIFYRCGYEHIARRAGVTMIVYDSGYYVNKVVIKGNIFVSCEQGVRIGNYNENHDCRAWIVGNWFEGCVYPVALYGNLFTVLLEGNVFRNNTNPPYIEAGKLYAKGNEGYDTENFKSAGVGVSVGTGGAYGSATSITSPSGRITLPRVKITWGGTFGIGETVTVKVEAVYTDGSTAYVEKSATAIGSQWLTDDDVLALITQGKDIAKLNVYAKTNLSSTFVTVTVDAYGKG